MFTDTSTSVHSIETAHGCTTHILYNIYREIDFENVVAVPENIKKTADNIDNAHCCEHVDLQMHVGAWSSLKHHRAWYVSAGTGGPSPAAARHVSAGTGGPCPQDVPTPNAPGRRTQDRGPAMGKKERIMTRTYEELQCSVIIRGSLVKRVTINIYSQIIGNMFNKCINNNTTLICIVLSPTVPS